MDKISVSIPGCNGRMGKTLLSLIQENPKYDIAAATCLPSENEVGVDIGLFIGKGKINKVIFNAHRICTPEKVYTMFKGLELIDEKYALSDRIISKKEYDKIDRPYSYGCYYFTKRK